MSIQIQKLGAEQSRCRQRHGLQRQIQILGLLGVRPQTDGIAIAGARSRRPPDAATVSRGACARAGDRDNGSDARRRDRSARSHDRRRQSATAPHAPSAAHRARQRCTERPGNAPGSSCATVPTGLDDEGGKPALCQSIEFGWFDVVGDDDGVVEPILFDQQGRAPSRLASAAGDALDHLVDIVAASTKIVVLHLFESGEQLVPRLLQCPTRRCRSAHG